jgi:hypothetical protein
MMHLPFLHRRFLPQPCGSGKLRNMISLVAHVDIYSVEFQTGHQNISMEDNEYRNVCMDTSGH